VGVKVVESKECDKSVYKFFVDASSWIKSLSLNDIPFQALEHFKIMFIDYVGSIAAALSSTQGVKLAKNHLGLREDKPYGYLKLLPALSVLLDFDSTLLFYGHIAHGVLGSLIAMSMRNEVTGRDLVEAGIAASEISARVAASLVLSDVRGQMMSFLHALSSAITLSKLTDSGEDEILCSMGNALSYTIRPTREGFASLAKLLVASTSTLHGLLSYELCKSLGGRPRGDVFDSFMKSWSHIIIHAPLGNLSRKWHITTLSVKKYPACSYAQTAIDAAHHTYSLLVKSDLHKIEEIILEENILTHRMDTIHSRFIRGSQTEFTVLQFYTPYLIAYTLAHGSFDHKAYDEASINEAGIWDIASKIKLYHNRKFTRELLKEPLPFGLALNEIGRLKASILLLKLLGIEGIELLKSIWLGEQRDIEKLEFEELKKIMPIALEIKVRGADKIRIERKTVEGFHGTGIDSKKYIALNKLGYLSRLVGDDDAETVTDIILKLDKAGYDEVKLMTTTIHKALQQTMIVVHT
jgi:2-methylcitrate dehydratase PrpD